MYEKMCDDTFTLQQVFPKGAEGLFWRILEVFKYQVLTFSLKVCLSSLPWLLWKAGGWGAGDAIGVKNWNIRFYNTADE